MNTLGDLIKEVRKKSGLTTTQLAEMVEVSQGYISHLENERKKNPSPDVLARIAKVLDIPYIDLMVKAGYLTGNDLSELYLKRDELKSKQAEYRNKKKEFINKAEDIELKLQKYLTIDELNDKEQGEVSSLSKERSELLKQAKDLRDQSEDLSVEIDEINDLIRNSLEYKEATQDKNMIENSVGESKSNVELENLFSMAQEITINGKVLTDEEKQKALQILKLTFDK
ncbi:helix-turn-helix domain-containing protein [Lysinibacillus sp. OL1_EC]|uniref:helix-turn-helix domain-containing protein n=1 Tax=unclassified Lysinibacillus TaxID=2636778 RepID=UPI00187D22FE|nr:transcriptional regulator [Lysinibacillus sp. OL1]MCM0626674.1 helix-turn-helix domain-containing protein [Lysinibacillus sp. OL1_EC]